MSASIYSAMFVVKAMTSWFVTFSISSMRSTGEVGVRADPGRLFLRDAALAQLCLGFAGQHLDLFPR